MPITYAQPDPVIPGISSAYGAAQQFSQDAPTIAGLAEHAASLVQSGQQRADQLRLAYAEANSKALNESADRYQRGDIAQASREQQSNDLSAQLDASSTANMLHANTALIQQQRGAELQNWLGQQELTQKENMRLQQQKQAIGDVMASNLPDDVKQEQVLKLKTGVDAAEQRKQAAQTKELNAQTAKMEQATLDAKNLQIKQAALDAQSVEQRASYSIPADVQAETEAKFDQQFPEITAAANAGGIQGAAAKAIRAKMIKEEASLDPRSQQLLQVYADKPPINLSAARHDQSEARRQTDVKLYQDAMKHYDDKLDKAMKIQLDVGYTKPAGEEGASPEDRAKASLAREGIFRPTPLKAKEERQAFSAYRPKTPESAPTQVPPAQTSPSEVHRQSAEGVVNNSLQAIQSRQDLAPEVKVQAAFALQEAQSMLASAGGRYASLNTEQKAKFDQLAATYRKLAPAPVAPTGWEAGLRNTINTR